MLGPIVVPEICQPPVKMILADSRVEEMACQRSRHALWLVPVVLLAESVAPPAQVVLPYVRGDIAQEAMTLTVRDDLRLKGRSYGGELLCTAHAWILADPAAQRLTEPVEGRLAKRAISDRLTRFNDLVECHRRADVPQATLPRRVHLEEVQHSPDDVLGKVAGREHAATLRIRSAYRPRSRRDIVPIKAKARLAGPSQFTPDRHIA